MDDLPVGTETGPRDAPVAESFEIVNEFAEVQVRKIWTRNGARLEIVAPRVGRVIRLCPLELESLTWQSTATFSAFLATPHGPEAEE